uniref:Uncharacterized protein n=1 Tax=viral metagenome TaxID=1070528 RepID=A0A6M3IEI0_9ZZZZ
MTEGEKLIILQKLERFEERTNIILLNGAVLLQTLNNVKDEIKELPTVPFEGGVNVHSK